MPRRSLLTIRRAHRPARLSAISDELIEHFTTFAEADLR